MMMMVVTGTEMPHIETRISSFSLDNRRARATEYNAIIQVQIVHLDFFFIYINIPNLINMH
jgi:hypothetical protein